MEKAHVAAAVWSILWYASPPQILGRFTQFFSRRAAPIFGIFYAVFHVARLKSWTEEENKYSDQLFL